MSLLDQKFDDVKDLRSVEPGEYKVEILEVTEGIGQTSQKPYLKARLTLPDVPEAKDINHFVSIPVDEDEPKTVNFKLRQMKSFFNAFGIDLSGSSVADLLTERSLNRMIGMQAWAILEEEDGGEQYGTQNRVKRFM